MHLSNYFTDYKRVNETIFYNLKVFQESLFGFIGLEDGFLIEEDT